MPARAGLLCSFALAVNFRMSGRQPTERPEAPVQEILRSRTDVGESQAGWDC